MPFTKDSEGLPGSTMIVEYRNRKHEVDLIQSKTDLKTALQKLVIPALRLFRELDPNIDLAVTEYVYPDYESIRGKTESAGRMLNTLGMDSEDAERLARIGRTEGLTPVLEDRLKWRELFPDDNVDDKFLPFSQRTYLIAPMFVDQRVFGLEGGPILLQDSEASTFFINYAVAFDGKVLLEGEEESDRLINNQHLLELLNPLLEKK